MTVPRLVILVGCVLAGLVNAADGSDEASLASATLETQRLRNEVKQLKGQVQRLEGRLAGVEALLRELVRRQQPLPQLQLTIPLPHDKPPRPHFEPYYGFQGPKFGGDRYRVDTFFERPSLPRR